MLPKSIAHHENLEHLLLTNNNIQKLPNELGLVPNLKALQLADNPLVYPPRKIIQEGTKAIRKYLREQYDVTSANNVEKFKAQEQERLKREKELLESQQLEEMQEEKLIKVHEKLASASSFDHIHRVSKENFPSANARFASVGPKDSNSSNLRTPLDKNNSKFFDPKGLCPTLRVKKLDFPNKKQQEEPLKIIHNLDKSDSKISIKSYFNTTGIKGNLDRIPENSLKEGWLNKLRILLNDQERILQQERNLRSLSTWRQKPAAPLKNTYDGVTSKGSEAPFATYPEYSKMPSRTELTAQLQTFLTESDLVQSRIPKLPINIDKLIDDLVEQLREMEILYGDTNSPRNDMEQAGKQIQKIVDIHKKLLKLKSANDWNM